MGGVSDLHLESQEPDEDKVADIPDGDEDELFKGLCEGYEIDCDQLAIPGERYCADCKAEEYDNEF